MSTQPRPGTQHTINLGGIILEEFESFKYLGSSFIATGQAKDGISGRNGLERRDIAQDQGPHLRGTDPDESDLRLRDVAFAC